MALDQNGEGRKLYRCHHRGQGCRQPRRTNIGLHRAAVLGLQLIGDDVELQAAIRRELELARTPAPRAGGGPRTRRSRHGVDDLVEMCIRDSVWAVVMLSDAATSCGTPGAGWALAGSSSPNVATPMRMRAGIPACQALPIAISALRFEQPFEPYVRVGNCGYEFTRSSRFVRRDVTIRMVVTSLAARARPAVLLRRRCTSCTRRLDSRSRVLIVSEGLVEQIPIGGFNPGTWESRRQEAAWVRFL